MITAAEPDIITTRHLRVDVETAGIHTRGRTVVDVYGVTGRAPNAEVSFDLDLDRFKKHIFDAIREMDGRQ
jgi:inosine-uridine nucleoside N-ribohydrolase